MFNSKTTSKIKNEKTARWRIELSCFSFDISYRPGKENLTADTLSRVCCTASSRDEPRTLHNHLCHPGITRMVYAVRCRNLPFSVEEVKRITNSCHMCAEIKPRFYKPKTGILIKATQPFERLNLDFKGPLPSKTRNRYILTVVDEYSRFHFSFACSDISATAIIQCLCSLFAIFGTPAYIHSD